MSTTPATPATTPAAIYTLHAINQAKLDMVIEEMAELGAPTIRACWQGDHWCALEGVHRVEAARLLDMPVTIAPLSEGDILDDHDLYDLPDDVLVAEVLSWADWTHGGHIQAVRLLSD